MELKRVFPIIAMLLVVLTLGCKKDEDNAVRPTVSSTDPVNSATGVAIDSKITATFSVAMNASSITTANFTLLKGTVPVAGAVSYTGKTATFTPTANLTPNTLYTATITTGARDVAGTSLAKNYRWTFTTSTNADVVLPTVALTDPANNATGVTIDHLIVITFSESMNPTTITALTVTLQQGVTAVSGAVTYSGLAATFTPTADLEPNKIYTVTVTTGVKDLAGNALASNLVFSFTTGDAPDSELPTVTSTDPLNNATGVVRNKVVSVVFSEAMDPLTISTSTFTLMQGVTAVSGAVAYSGTTATFTPTSDLEPNKIYTITVTTGVKDLAGNALASDQIFTFTTGYTPDAVLPTVTSTDPLINAIGVARNKVISAVFSEEMDPLTITSLTFTLTQDVTAVTGTVAYSGTTATFTPDNNLLANTIYTATISIGAKDMAGNALADNTVWNFTTGGTTSLLPVVDLGAAGNYVILAKTAISNIPASAITGDMGLSPAATSYITGFGLTDATGYATAPEVTGKIYAADMADPTPINLTTAVNNMITAYNDAAGRPFPDFVEMATGNIGGKTLTPGLYKWGTSVIMSSDVTISGGPDDVWIFQIAQNLSLSSAVRITLEGGAQAKNIFWQVAGQATLGTTTHFEGVILSMTGITFQTGASMNGRALAQTAVALDQNAITQP